MDKPLEPAASIIERFGGPVIVRQVTGVSRTRVYRWTQPKAQGGTGGLVPNDAAIKLLRYARENSIPVTADHFLPVDHPEMAETP